jgi:hypothetical protein
MHLVYFVRGIYVFLLWSVSAAPIGGCFCSGLYLPPLLVATSALVCICRPYWWLLLLWSVSVAPTGGYFCSGLYLPPLLVANSDFLSASRNNDVAVFVL